MRRALALLLTSSLAGLAAPAAAQSSATPPAPQVEGATPADGVPDDDLGNTIIVRDIANPSSQRFLQGHSDRVTC